MTTVHAIVVTYNSAGCIQACLDSLRAAGQQCRLTITVVDNASLDQTVTIVKSYFPDIQILTSPTNLGYAGGNNLALRQFRASKATAEGILILNPDVELAPGCLDRLASILLSQDDVGGVSPVTLVEGDLDAVVPSRTLWGRPLKPGFRGSRDLMEVDRLHGSCMLLRPQVIEDIGLLDEDFFLYWEELEFCRRAIRHHWKLLVVTEIKLKHRYDQPQRLLTVYYMYRNLFLYSSKAYSIPLRWLFLWRRLLGTNMLELFTFLRSGRYDLLRAAGHGFWAGVCREKGPSPLLWVH